LDDFDAVNLCFKMVYWNFDLVSENRQIPCGLAEFKPPDIPRDVFAVQNEVSPAIFTLDRESIHDFLQIAK